MQRGSDKHGPRLDEALDAETRGLTTSGRETRAEEHRGSEPSGEDQPAVGLGAETTVHGGVPDGMTEADVELRSQLGQVLGASVWPASGAQLLGVATEREAPEALLATLRVLPADQVFANLQEAFALLSGGAVEDHRF